MEMSSDGRPTLVRRSRALYRVQLYSVQCSAASTALYSSLLSVLQNNWTPTHHMEADMVTWPQEESESSDQSIN